MRNGVRNLLIELVLAMTFAAVAGVTAYYVSERLPASYRAAVVWRVAVDPDASGLDLRDVREAARSFDVLMVALAELGETDRGVDRTATLRRHVRVSLDRGVDTRLTLQTTGETPGEAERRAAAVAAAMEAWDRDATMARLALEGATLDERIDEVDERIRSLQVLGPSDGDELRGLVAERERLVALAEGGAPARTLERVAVVEPRLVRSTTRNVVLAASAAVLLSLILGVRWPRRWRDEGRAPRAKGRGAARAGRRSALASFPRTDDAEAKGRAAAQLRASLGASMGEARPRIVLVTGIGDRRGTTTVSCALAEETVRRGSRALLVDADLREPGLASVYGLRERADDVATTLDWLQDPTGEHRLASVTTSSGRALDLVPQFRATRPAPGTSETLFDGFGEAVRRWRDYDVVVVDTGPVLAVDDTRLLARWATGIVLVVAPGWDDARAWQEVRSRLGGAAARLLGHVENDVPPPPPPRSEDEDEDEDEPQRLRGVVEVRSGVDRDDRGERPS